MTLKTNFIRNLQQQKWYIINDQNNGNENDLTIKFEAKVIKPNLCDYSDAYIFVTGDITVTVGNVDTKVLLQDGLHT